MGISFWRWSSWLLYPPPHNSFLFYSWTRLDYRESLDLLVPGCREDNNRELRVVSVPGFAQIFVSRSRSRSRSRPVSRPVSRSLLFQLPFNNMPLWTRRWRFDGITFDFYTGLPHIYFPIHSFIPVLSLPMQERLDSTILKVTINCAKGCWHSELIALIFRKP